MSAQRKIIDFHVDLLIYLSRFSFFFVFLGFKLSKILLLDHLNKCHKTCHMFVCLFVNIERQSHRINIKPHIYCVNIERQSHRINIEPLIYCVNIERQSHRINIELHIYCVKIERQSHRINFEPHIYCVNIELQV